MIEMLAPRYGGEEPCVGVRSGYPGLLLRTDGKFCKAPPVAGPAVDLGTAWRRLDALLRDVPQVVSYYVDPTFSDLHVRVKPGVDLSLRLEEGLGSNQKGRTWYGWPLSITTGTRLSLAQAAEEFDRIFRKGIRGTSVRGVLADRASRAIRVRLWGRDGFLPTRLHGWPVVVDSSGSANRGGPRPLGRAADELGRRWLGREGIFFVGDDGLRGVILVRSTRMPSKLPRFFGGWPVRVELGVNELRPQEAVNRGVSRLSSPGMMVLGTGVLAMGLGIGFAYAAALRSGR